MGNVFVRHADDPITRKNWTRFKVIHRIARNVKSHHSRVREPVVLWQRYYFWLRLIHFINFAECSSLNATCHGNRNEACCRGGQLTAASLQAIPNPKDRLANRISQALHDIAARLIYFAIQIFIYVRVRDARFACEFRTAPAQFLTSVI